MLQLNGVDLLKLKFYYAVMVAAAVLQGVNHFRDRFSPNAQRVLADIALLVPLPLFLVM